MFTLQTEQWLPKAIAEVFPFFANAHNLQTITPPWLDFEVLTPAPLEMKPGARIDYRLKIRGVPVRWQSEITVWEPPHRFVDEQRRGPYRVWHHEHTFRAQDGGTLATDTVHYDVWGGRWIQRWLVAPDVEKIFAYRRDRLREIFG
jgi:hypothetical protein